MLDDELHVLVRKAFARTDRAMARFIQTLGLKPGQPKVLEYLSEHDGDMARNICQGCAIDKSTLTALLPPMERAGLVSRQANAQDARSIRVYLTGRGRELADAVRAGAHRIDARAAAGISEDDLAATLRVLRHVAELDDGDLLAWLNPATVGGGTADHAPAGSPAAPGAVASEQGPEYAVPSEKGRAAR